MSEMINPYIAGAPVTERTMFFGRQDVFEWVQRSLTGKFVDHILVIHGQRRVGKTSVLKQIPFHLPAAYIPVFFDLQGRTHTSIDRFLWRLAKEITRTLRTAENISLPEPSRGDFSRDPEFFENQFLRQLSQAIGDRRLLLIFDEFDSLEEPTAREMLAQDLIPYLSRLMHAHGPLAFIFSIGSSGRKLEHMQASYTDFFRIALYRKISFLKREEVSRLITQPVVGVIEYDAQAVGDIFDITSGHPYFTQLLCHELFGYCQRTGKRHLATEDIQAVLDDVVERGTVNLKFVWDDASDPERYVLTGLSLAEDGRDARSIHDFLEGQKVRISPREVADSLRHLQEKDVLASDNSFTVDLMRLWLLQNKPIGRVIEELIEVSPIATRFIEIAQEFHETGMPDEALSNYRRALEVDPQNLAAQVGIASLIFEQGDLLQAADEYQKALDSDPDDVAARSGFCQTHLTLGDQLREEGEVEGALEHYRQVLSVNEQHVEARERLAAHHEQRGVQLKEEERFEEAIEAFQRALEFTPDDPQITEQLAQTRAARRAKGLATLRERGEEHFGAERWDQAIACFEEYLSLEPEDEEAARAVEPRLAEAREQGELAQIYRQAQAALSQKRYEQAVGLLKKIIDRDVSYRDATRLLTQAVELQREVRPMWKDIRVLGGAGGAIVVIITALLLFRFLPGFAPAPTPFTPTPMPTATPAPIGPATATPAPGSPTATSPAETPAPLTETRTPAPATPTFTPPAQTPTPTVGPPPPVRTLTGGQMDRVVELAFSPNSMTLASGSPDGTAILWDVQTGQQLRTVDLEGGHTLGWHRIMAFSPDTQILASGSDRGTVRLWSVSNGTLLHTLEGHTDEVWSVAFSPDGQTLASGSKDWTVRLWQVSDGTLLRTLQGHWGWAASVAFSPDGAILAAGSLNGTVRLWQVSDGTLLRTLQAPWEVLTLAFSPDGATLASGWSNLAGDDHGLILWDVETGEQLRTLRGHTARPTSVAFSPDGTILASASEDRTVRLWRMSDGVPLGTLEGHSYAVSCVTFSPDGTTLASGSEIGKVMLWDVEQWVES